MSFMITNHFKTGKQDIDKGVSVMNVTKRASPLCIHLYTSLGLVGVILVFCFH